jgi:hypothetical protein
MVEFGKKSQISTTWSRFDTCPCTSTMDPEAGGPLVATRPRPRYNAAMSIEERSRARKTRIVAHISHSYQEAEQWDLQYWQSLPPASRLSALVAIRRDIERIKKSGKPPN